MPGAPGVASEAAGHEGEGQRQQAQQELAARKSDGWDGPADGIQPPSVSSAMWEMPPTSQPSPMLTSGVPSQPPRLSPTLRARETFSMFDSPDLIMC